MDIYDPGSTDRDYIAGAGSGGMRGGSSGFGSVNFNPTFNMQDAFDDLADQWRLAMEQSIESLADQMQDVYDRAFDRQQLA